MNEHIDWDAMQRGYDRPFGGRGVECGRGPWLRVRWGGADNADNYAQALAWGAHALANNCASHLLVGNVGKKHSTLWRLLGGDSEEGVRPAVYLILKLLRDIPCLVSAGRVAANTERRDDGIFAAGWKLLLEELRAAGWVEAAASFESEYLSSRRKRRWAGCYFPPLIPNHNCGVESMNAKTVLELSKFRLTEIVAFTGMMLTHMEALAEERRREGFNYTTVRLLQDWKVWRNAHALMEPQRRDRDLCVSEQVQHLQMHAARAGFGRANAGERWSVPTGQLLAYLLEEHNGHEGRVLAALAGFREMHLRLVKNPEDYVRRTEATLNEYLRLAVRAFYVLERLPDGDVRSKHCRYSCTCGYYRVRSYCKHAVALTAILGLEAVPPDLNYAVVGRLGRRGRKRRKVDVQVLSVFSQGVDLAGKSGLYDDDDDAGGHDDSGSGSE
jgi:hypothetical protein